jgi:hypothetical protein
MEMNCPTSNVPRKNVGWTLSVQHLSNKIPIGRLLDTPSFCGCAECKIDGVRVPRPPFHRFHDCEYVRKRGRLIPQAERIANERVPVNDGNSSAEWTRVFASAMDALSAPLLNGANDNNQRGGQ